MSVGDTKRGNLHHFVPNATRGGFTFVSPELPDLVADNSVDTWCFGEQAEFHFGSGFGVVTDIKTGPEGNVYIVELLSGSVYRIVPALTPGDDADGDGVNDACDCSASDPGSSSATAEVPRLRVPGEAATNLGWDSQRATNGCGAGTFGDATTQSDPRDLIDATLPASCSTIVAGIGTGRAKLR